MATWYAPEGGPIKTETDPLWTAAPEPLGAAVQTLAEMEAAVLNESPQAVVLRYGGFYGPGTRYAKDAEIAAGMRRRMMPMIGDGSGITSFVHLEDAASAAVAGLAAPPGVYNIADGHPARASEWMPAFADCRRRPAPDARAGVPGAPGVRERAHRLEDDHARGVERESPGITRLAPR